MTLSFQILPVKILFNGGWCDHGPHSDSNTTHTKQMLFVPAKFDILNPNYILMEQSKIGTIKLCLSESFIIFCLVIVNLQMFPFLVYEDLQHHNSDENSPI